MTREDIERLFELLAIYRPGDKHLENGKLRSAWLLVLAPYSPEEVREAVAAYFREKKFWPDVTDIASRCPPLPERVMPAREGRQDQEDLYRQWKRWTGTVDQAGLPATITQARKAGLPLEAWEAILTKAGLDCPPEWRSRPCLN